MSNGVNASEQILALLCRNSFLRLWSYANPFKDDGHEFCDVISIFEHHVFIFFDRERELREFGVGEDVTTRWRRWKRHVIDKQIATAHGAARYLQSGRPIFLDAQRRRPLPVRFNLDDLTIHKIIVANGATNACKSFSEQNVFGSLAVVYDDTIELDIERPFFIRLDRVKPVHLLDSHNLPILLSELDTVRDLSDYLDTKIALIEKHKVVLYCGEEDFLAYYLSNLSRDGMFDQRILQDIDVPFGLSIAEGAWQSLTSRPSYKATKMANSISYAWDRFIDDICSAWLDGELTKSVDLLSGRNAVHEMAKEPRHMRRKHSRHIIETIQSFNPNLKAVTVGFRQVRLFESFYKNKAYIILQLLVPFTERGSIEEEQQKRKSVLDIACGAAKNRFPHLKSIIGIAMEPPKVNPFGNKELVLFECEAWTTEQQQDYEVRNTHWKFFQLDEPRHRTVTRFVYDRSKKKSKTKRNERCPCGSGRKFKRCHGS